MTRFVFWMLMLGAAFQTQLPALQAAGREHPVGHAADLVVSLDSRWAGCGHGGYYPLRIKVANRGLDCNLIFVFTRQMDQAVPTVRRSINVARNSTARLTLSIPCVGDDSYGSLHVYRDGRLIKQLTETVSLPETQAHSPARPALLIISSTDEHAEAFETAVTTMLTTAPSSASSYGYRYYSAITKDHQTVGPEMLPDSWIDYSGLDFVAVPLKTLGSLSIEERTALLKWVHCGGTLIVYEVGEPAGQSLELARLLERTQRAALSPSWEPAKLSRRKKITIPLTDVFGNPITVPQSDPDESSGDGASGTPSNDFVWPESVETFAGRRLMMGYVFAFPENPFPGSPHDWNWFIESVPEEHRTWTERHGFTARWGSDEFLKFLIPSVKGVPVFAFLLLITMFTIAIGPLNYLWLWKKRRLYLLVLTIPAIALGTSLALFAYSAVAHGFGTKSRARTLTLIDQNSNTAVTMSRIALYAGLAPSDGLRFSPETAVYPIWPEKTGFQSGTVDWTERQKLSGWLRSRTRTQFLTVSHRDERGRLIVSSPVDGRLRVENGLEWGLDALIVSDEQGELFYGTGIAAGASVELSPVTVDQQTEFAGLLGQHQLVPPYTSGSSSDFFDWGFDPYSMFGGSTPVRYESSLQEQQLATLGRLEFHGAEFQPESYAAVVSENPGVELGIGKTRSQASLHVLMGRY